MDLLNSLFARTGAITKIEVRLIGRMSAGWLRGRFLYDHPDEMHPVANELYLGYFTHYTIGIFLAIAFVLGWDILFDGHISPLWVLIYGISTTAASLFFVYPSMGLGIAGSKSPEGVKNIISSLANHLFFGTGMAILFAVI
jgi:hypothetical protein